MTPIDRRGLLSAMGALGVAASAPALAASFPLPKGFTRMPLWPGRAPGGEKVTVQEVQGLRRADSGPEDSYFEHVVAPSLTMLRPARPNGAAMLLIPGGGYRRVVIGHEGYAIARRFVEAGYTCFILLYRLPADGWAAGPKAPLQDAQRALRLVRSMAAREKFDAERVGVIGFSAGGHLAGWLTTQGAAPAYAPVDSADTQPIKAGVAGLMYPVVLMDNADGHAGSREQLLGPSPTRAVLDGHSLDLNVAAGTCPVFLAHALDDTVVTPANSIAMLGGLRRARVPAECHLFENGGHGFGITPQAASATPWPELFLAFAKRHGV